MLENLEALKGNNRRRCGVRRILEGLEGDDRRIFANALDDKDGWSTHALYKALNELGIEVSQTPLYRHRDGLCSCRNTDA